MSTASAWLGSTDQAVAGARDQLARNVGGQQPRQLVARGGVAERLYGDGLDGLRHQVAAAGHVVAAAAQDGARQQHARRAPAASYQFPRHRHGVLRLQPQVVGHEPEPAGHAASLRSGEMAPTAMPPCPACPTLVGGSNSSPRTSMPAIAGNSSKRFHLRRIRRTPPTRRSCSRGIPAPESPAAKASARPRLRPPRPEARPGAARCAVPTAPAPPAPPARNAPAG